MEIIEGTMNIFHYLDKKGKAGYKLAELRDQGEPTFTIIKAKELKNVKEILVCNFLEFKKGNFRLDLSKAAILDLENDDDFMDEWQNVIRQTKVDARNFGNLTILDDNTKYDYVSRDIFIIFSD